MWKNVKLTISFEITFSYLKCVAYLFLVPILKSSRRHLVNLFETATLPSKRMERQTTPSIAGQTSLHKSLSPQQQKSRIAIKTTVPQSPINFTPNTCAMAAERLVKNGKFAFEFASSAFLRRSCTSWRQRSLARWFHPQIWLVHLNLSARWQHNPLPEGSVHFVANQVSHYGFQGLFSDTCIVNNSESQLCLHLRFWGSLQTYLNMSSVVKRKVSGLSEANDGDLPQNSFHLWRVVLSAPAQIQMDQSDLRVKQPRERPLPPARTRASKESRRGEF